MFYGKITMHFRREDRDGLLRDLSEIGIFAETDYAGIGGVEIRIEGCEKNENDD